MTDPPPISFSSLSEKKKIKRRKNTCHTWHVTHDTWHVTRDVWHVTRDTWHVTCDMLWGVNIHSKFQLPKSYSVWFMKFWRLEEKADWQTPTTTTRGLLNSDRDSTVWGHSQVSSSSGLPISQHYNPCKIRSSASNWRRRPLLLHDPCLTSVAYKLLAIFFILSVFGLKTVYLFCFLVVYLWLFLLSGNILAVFLMDRHFFANLKESISLLLSSGVKFNWDSSFS